MNRLLQGPSRARQGATLLALTAGCLVRSPALSGGLRGDDFTHNAMLSGAFPSARQAWDLFRFAGPSASQNAPLMDFGYLPWWSSDELSLAMWRPLASLLAAADRTLFGDAVGLYHAHSMLWWMLAVWLVGRLLFIALPAPAAALSLVVFALDEAHNVPVAWLANRSTLITLALGTVALLAHMRVQTTGDRRALVLEWCALALTVAAGEYALSVLCLPVAYEALRPTTVTKRVQALAPTASMIALYLATRSLTGHGVTDSGFYLSPISDPLGYAIGAAERAPVLLADLIFGMPALEWFSGGVLHKWIMSFGPFDRETWKLVPDYRHVHAALGYVAVGVYVALYRYARGGLPPAARSALAWLALGAVVGLIPAASAIPEDRVTGAASIGVSAVLGAALWRALQDARRRIWLAGPLALGLAGLHLGLAPVRDFERVRGFANMSRAQAAWALDAEMPTTNADLQRVYLLSAGDFMTAVNLPFVRRRAGLPMPMSYRRLSGSTLAHDLTRTGAQQLTVMAHGGAVRGTMTGSLYRPLHKPIARGQRFELPGMRVQVLTEYRGNPVTMAYEFDRSLDDPTLWLLHSTKRGVRRITPPKLGETLRVGTTHGAH